MSSVWVEFQERVREDLPYRVFKINGEEKKILITKIINICWLDHKIKLPRNYAEKLGLQEVKKHDDWREYQVS